MSHASSDDKRLMPKKTLARGLQRVVTRGGCNSRGRGGCNSRGRGGCHRAIVGARRMRRDDESEYLVSDNLF